MNYELYHYGIKGMKWGVRRYQNKDGSLTDAGKHRLAKSIQKQAKGNSTSERSALVDDVRKDLVKNYKTALRSEISKINDAKAKWLAIDTPDNDYWESGAARKDSAKAYKQTLAYFKKNDPAFLKEIIAKNGGDEHGLDAFHDFRKRYEGYEDVAWQQGEKKFYKERKIDQKAMDKAYDDYKSALKSAAKSVVGNYGNMPVSKAYQWDFNSNVQNIVEQALTSKASLDDFMN